MAYATRRGERWTGYYRDRYSRRHSAGTFDSQQEALQQAQAFEATGMAGGLDTHLSLSDYVQKWLPRADLLPLTKKNYEAVLRVHVLPVLGKRKVSQISRIQVREMLDILRQSGVGASTRIQAKSALGSALEALVEADQLESNPTHKIRIKQLESNQLRNVLEPEEFKDILSHLPNPTAQLFATFLAVSGARFGEATEIRVKDLNFKAKEVYLQRRVNELGARTNNGERFRVLEATKSGHRRAVVLSEHLLLSLQDHVRHMGRNDLLFSKALVTEKPDVKVTSNTSGHLPRDTWRRMWQEAIKASGVEWIPRTHDLRHANATLMLKNGVDLHEVKERLGHQSVKTTERYLHRIKAQSSRAAESVAEFI
ncbi:XerC Integrase [uncultured Caudovirales phage]|uniref:Integrase n=1 Tax=uncultured Caudovirales phage TaxID=2100421 RepID=A0A6J5KS88_9CAUD|nr:XerC Integrase [uncultured Caudovirales phage]